MPYYECVFIARQDVPSAQIEPLTQHFAEIISENGGTVAKTEYWGLKTLAYRIKKNRKGHYVLMNLDAPHAAVAEMERLMGLHDDVLRNLTVRVDALEEGPSIMMQSRAGRDGPRRGRDRDRGDRGSDRGGDRDRDRGDRDRDRGDRGGDRDRDRERPAAAAAPAETTPPAGD